MATKAFEQWALKDRESMTSVELLDQWALTDDESITTIEAWKNNLMHILSLEEAFVAFLQPDASWRIRTKTNKLRGFNEETR